MAEGLTNDLLWAAFCMGLLSFWIASRQLSITTSFLVAVVKILIPLVYFAFFYDGTWTFLDDIKYQSQGTKMLQLGYNPITALFAPKGLSYLFSLSGGRHILYGWWNLLGQYLFGKHYYSPVFLNIALTFVISYFIVRIACLSGFSQKYARGLFLFSLFQWDILVWSSLINLKDIIVTTLTVISLYLILKLSKQIKIYYLLALGATLFVFFWIRFYIPLAIVIATIVWIALVQTGWRRYFLFFMAAIGSVLVFNLLGVEATLNNFRKLDLNVATLATGVIKMSLTPQPWSIAPEYTFLFYPANLHWLFFFPAISGGWMLWRRSRAVALLLIYLALAFLFYGSYAELNGPRQRLQVTPIIAWMQFHFCWVVLQKRQNSYLFKAEANS